MQLKRNPRTLNSYIHCTILTLLYLATCKCKILLGLKCVNTITIQCKRLLSRKHSVYMYGNFTFLTESLASRTAHNARRDAQKAVPEKNDLMIADILVIDSQTKCDSTTRTIWVRNQFRVITFLQWECHERRMIV